MITDLTKLTLENLIEVAHSSGYGTVDWRKAEFVKVSDDGQTIAIQYIVTYTDPDFADDQECYVYVALNKYGKIVLDF